MKQSKKIILTIVIVLSILAIAAIITLSIVLNKSKNNKTTTVEPIATTTTEEPVVTTTTVEKYTVSFMVDSEVYKTIDVEKGSKVAKPDDPVKTGYAFGGWYKESEATTQSYFDFNQEVVE